MSDPIKASVLILDPDRDFLADVARTNPLPNLTLMTEHFDARERGKLSEILTRHYPDVVVINLDVDNEIDFGGPIQEIQGIPLALCPLILGTSNRDAFALRQKIYRMGIDDFLLRPFPPLELWFRVEALLRIRRLQRQIDASARNLSLLNTKLAASNRKLEQLTLTDELTGLSNMRYLHKFLEGHFLMIKRNPRPFTLLMMDLDHFKSVNDRNDHLVGSATIGSVGRLIGDTMRKADIKGRYGGDEYIVAMPDTDEAGAVLAADRLRERIGEMVHFGSQGAEFRVTASMGLAGFDPARHETYQDIIKDADCALYESKRAGRNRVTYYQHGVTPRPDAEKLKRTFTTDAEEEK